MDLIKTASKSCNRLFSKYNKAGEKTDDVKDLPNTTVLPTTTTTQFKSIQLEKYITQNINSASDVCKYTSTIPYRTIFGSIMNVL